MVRSDNSERPQPPSSGTAAPARGPGLGILHMVVAWRTILALTAIAVLTASLFTLLAWPFWDAEPRVITVTRPAPLVPAGELEDGRREADRLMRRIAALEEEIARKRASCPRPPQPTQSEPPPPQPDQRSNLNCEETCRLCRENKRELTGDVSVSLAWDGYADLDLHLSCPNADGIKYSNRQGCGGHLNVDMNIPSKRSAEPIENITLTERSPAGRYKVFVHFFRMEGQQSTVPFRVNVNIRGQSRTFEGTAIFPRDNNQMILVHEFDLSATAEPRNPEQGATFQLQCDQCNCSRAGAITPAPGAPRAPAVRPTPATPAAPAAAPAIAPPSTAAKSPTASAPSEGGPTAVAPPADAPTAGAPPASTSNPATKPGNAP